MHHGHGSKLICNVVNQLGNLIVVNVECLRSDRVEWGGGQGRDARGVAAMIDDGNNEPQDAERRTRDARRGHCSL